MDPSAGMHMSAVPQNSDVVHVSVGNPIITMYQPQPQPPNIAQIITQHVVPQDVACQAVPHTIQSHVQMATHIQTQSHIQPAPHLQHPPQSHVEAQAHIPTQEHVSTQGPSDGQCAASSQDGSVNSLQVPFAEVASLLDPNMKSSKARKYQIHYEEVKRRLEPPEKMSLRSLAAYTRVSRGPASDTAALCKDMKDFALQYVDYENMAKQLLPETNQVQHWSKIIETRNYLEEMRKIFNDPVNTRLFSNVTHGLGNGMMDVALDIIDTVIDRQIRILSGNTDPKPEPPVRRIRKRNRKPKAATEDGKPKEKGKRGRKKGKQMRLDSVVPEVQQSTEMESSVLTLVSVGYETISSGLNATNAVYVNDCSLYSVTFDVGVFQFTVSPTGGLSTMWLSSD
ncbi:transcription factor AP-2-alpha-like protein [Labeo rohita]|uniref:Transcription factor AP-2-alpha-like protein n=1 Tax=Labeo rohita TaxID=84645 RepID=A0A498MWH0_LABRO|nr:transcription factor AP-2-alpha-like protein [Labeo rohita]